MSNELPVTALVARAAKGDKRAWDALIQRYAPLIWSICRRYQLGAAEAEDVGQTVWLQLLEHLDEIRDPAALAGWLATTTRRNAAGQRGDHGLPAECWTLSASRTSRRGWQSRSCWWLSGTLHCARRSGVFPAAASN
jgi:hypothetical protein